MGGYDSVIDSRYGLELCSEIADIRNGEDLDSLMCMIVI